VSEVQQVPLIADVAAAAGVSAMTVSRVMNGKDHVSGPTRARVLDAAASLGYRPNLAARTLSSGRSTTVGVVTLEGPVNGPASTLAGIEQEARSLGYAVSVAILSELTPSAVVAAVASFRALAVAGIILSAPHTDINDSLLPPSAIPMVAVEGFDGAVPVVAVDQHLGAVLATEHLTTAGHRDIHHIAGPADRHESLRREAGWRSALRAAHLEEAPVLRGDWTPSSGYQLGRQLIDQEVSAARATAVFVANDQMAIGVLRALAEAEIAVPGRMSVVGFDDIPEAAYLTPSLSTVRYDFAQLGRHALRRLLDDINGVQPGRITAPTSTLLEPALVLRESSGPPATPKRRLRVSSTTT